MNCTQFTEHLDEYADGTLHAGLQQQAEQHLEQCESCRQALSQQREMMQALHDIPVPAMRPGFAAQALKRASEQQHHQRRGFVKGFGSALVAGLAIWVATLVMLPQQPPIEGELSRVMLSLNEQRTINLVFNSPQQVADAQISLILPPNVEVVGFPGQREIAWRTHLNQGKNVLPLPLKANAPVEDQLLASIESKNSKKTFVVEIGMTANKQSNLLLTPETIG